MSCEISDPDGFDFFDFGTSTHTSTEGECGLCATDEQYETRDTEQNELTFNQLMFDSIPTMSLREKRKHEAYRQRIRNRNLIMKRVCQFNRATSRRHSYRPKFKTTSAEISRIIHKDKNFRGNQLCNEYIAYMDGINTRLSEFIVIFSPRTHIVK